MWRQLGRRPLPLLKQQGARFSSSAPILQAPTDLPTSVQPVNQLDALATPPVEDPWMIVDAAQKVIEAVHTTTGLPWWATLGLTAVAVRGTLFPLLVYQIKATERMAASAPEMRNVWKAYLYARLFLPPALPQKQVEAFSLMYKGVKLAWEKHQTHPIQCVSAPLVQVPSFLLMAYSTREIVRSGRFEGLETGGVWIFQNLVEADSTFILPAVAVACTYLNFEMMGTSKLPIVQFLKNKLQYIPLISFPFICQLPEGVFFYWIASSWCSFAQYLALRQPAIRESLGLKPAPTASGAASPSDALSGSSRQKNENEKY
ncbi:unnamed protein product [Aphanomyces euteiches]|nr:hypothetical protein Ae201684P_016429 [Aphanomyces euteiches]KAH9127176.1 hypothetical protein AeMF1_002487 [Aphanomyces euteiches]KAH9143972.1 hypothetical protein AeRB84_012068 [Aphanomyces euteiches]KAH9163892.1 hypothetical protein LEN26_000290 [Aphanomyces euteiches]KAH9187854.1 hypothetical protein AeNC1_010166 [Aphanomyces euteiches]